MKSNVKGEGKNFVQYVTGKAVGFPVLLKEIPDPPTALFYKGKLPLKSQRLVAVVGSREMSWRGKRAIEKLVPGLVAAGVGIVSGLARGVDAWAHQVCLRSGGYALAVLPTPLERIYPPENYRLAETILASGGCLLSEYPLGAVVRRENFLERNRLVAGLSLGTLVVEAAARSGSISTPNFAVDQGREVWVVPARKGQPNSEGILDLIADGATVVREIEDFGL